MLAGPQVEAVLLLLCFCWDFPYKTIDFVRVRVYVWACTRAHACVCTFLRFYRSARLPVHSYMRLYLNRHNPTRAPEESPGVASSGKVKGRNSDSSVKCHQNKRVTVEIASYMCYFPSFLKMALMRKIWTQFFLLIYIRSHRYPMCAIDAVSKPNCSCLLFNHLRGSFMPSFPFTHL